MKTHYMGDARLKSKRVTNDEGDALWVDFEHDIKMQNAQGAVVAVWYVGFDPAYTEAWYCGPREIPVQYNNLFDDVASLARESNDSVS